MVTAVDSSGNGNDGTYTGIDGNPGRQGLVTGNNAVHIGDGPNRSTNILTPILLDSTGPFTIACLWVPGLTNVFSAYFTSQAGGSFVLEFRIRDTSLRFNAGAQVWQSDFFASSVGSPQLVAFTFDNTFPQSTGVFYLDGVVVPNVIEPLFAIPAAAMATAGINADTADTVAGTADVVDEWASWNRVLSGGEIASLQAARGSFAAYNAAVLALSPTAYYHLDEFLPYPGGYLGLVAGPDPCAVQIESVYAARLIAFGASPYGASTDHTATPSFVPYLIDPATLEIEWREDLIVGPLAVQLDLAAVLDDSTMVFSDVGSPPNSSLYALTRSGITLAMSGAQQSSAMLGGSAEGIFRLDSSHILRKYRVPVTLDVVVEVFSVSGSTISLVASTTYAAGPATVSRDGGEAGTATLTIAAGTLFPFHYDGSGTLYCFGLDQSGFQRRIHAVPFSIGGSITAPGLSWRSRDATGVGGFVDGKIGSSECLVSRLGAEVMGFYDDGTQMHYLPTTLSQMLRVEQFADLDGKTTFGDYLTSDVLESPLGTPVDDSVADVVSQSGTTLSYTPVAVVVRCGAVTGTDIKGSDRPTRHDLTLGATSLHIGSSVYRLWAFKW